MQDPFGNFTTLLRDRMTSETITPETCRDWALQNGYNTYGVGDGKYCWGQQMYDNPTMELGPGCSTLQPCAGDSSMMCGGACAIQLYRVKSTRERGCDVRIQGGRRGGSSSLTLNISEIYLYTANDQQISASAIDAYMENVLSTALDPRLCFDNKLDTTCGTSGATDPRAATLLARFQCPGGRAVSTLDRIELLINVEPGKSDDLWYLVEVLDRDGNLERRYNVSAAKTKHVLAMYDVANPCLTNNGNCSRRLLSAPSTRRPQRAGPAHAGPGARGQATTAVVAFQQHCCTSSPKASLLLRVSETRASTPHQLC